MGVSGYIYTSAALFQGKEPRYLFDSSLGGPQSRSGRSRHVVIFFFIFLESFFGMMFKPSFKKIGQ
jgi:hypothetical protein